MSAGWTRHCTSTAANSLSVTSSVSTRHVNSHKILFSLVCYNRPKVSLQGLRGLALLPAEPSSDNPQILFQAMTDNGALSCTAATGQGGIFFTALQKLLHNPAPWKDVWNVTENRHTLSQTFAIVTQGSTFQGTTLKRTREKAEYYRHRHSQSTATSWRLQSCIKWEYMFTPQMKPFSLYDFLMDQSVVFLTMAKTRNHLWATE